MSTELVERLRPRIEGTGIWRTAGPDEDMQALADELTALTAKLERESGDLRYAKQALDRETARALKFGKRITALTAKVALLTEALKYAAMGLGRIHDSLLSNGPKQASGEMTMHFRDAARRALSEPDKEGT